MNKQIDEYISGSINVCEGTFTIGREKSSNGMEYIILSLNGNEIYSFWNNPKKKKSKKKATQVSDIVEIVEDIVKPTPKHTGGKPSYVKMMVDEVNKHPELSLNASGLIIKMIPNIQWGNNLLVNVRSKKPLLISDMTKILHISDKTIRLTLKELKTAGLLTKDKDGYKVSPKLLQKGVMISENKI